MAMTSAAKIEHFFCNLYVVIFLSIIIIIPTPCSLLKVPIYMSFPNKFFLRLQKRFLKISIAVSFFLFCKFCVYDNFSRLYGVCIIVFFILFKKSNLYFVIICQIWSGICFLVLFLVSLAAKYSAICIFWIQKGGSLAIMQMILTRLDLNAPLSRHKQNMNWLYCF